MEAIKQEDKTRIEKRAAEIYREWQSQPSFDITNELQMIAEEEHLHLLGELKAKDERIAELERHLSFYADKNQNQ